MTESDKKHPNDEFTAPNCVHPGIGCPSGFTLLELSLVLVVVALLMGTVLRGERIVDEGRVHRMALDQAAVALAIRSYVQLYHFYPGDDPRASQRWPGAVDGNGDGLIQSPQDGRQPYKNEERQVWIHLQLAHLPVPGTIDQSTTHPTRDGNVHLVHHAVGLPGLALCIDDVAPLQAASFDSRYDDGKGDDGRIRHPGFKPGDNGTIPSRPWPTEGEGVTICTAL